MKTAIVTKYLIESTASMALSKYPRGPSKTISIFGTPRSGTTWIMDIIGQLPSTKQIFEPLNPRWFPDIKKLKLPARPYLNPRIPFPEFREYLDFTFRGISRSYNPPYSLLDLLEMAKRFHFNNVLVKFVRANRLLPWIVENFPNLYIIFVIRHPCATILSQLKTGWVGYPPEVERLIRENPSLAVHPVKKIILENAKLLPDISGVIMRRIENTDSIIKLLAVEYALDQMIPLKYTSTKKTRILIISYEELVSNFNDAVGKIFSYLNEPIPPKVLNVYKKPSRTTADSDKKYIIHGRQLSKWKKQLTKRQISDILEVMDWFEFDIYTEKPEPDYTKFLKGEAL